MKKCVVLVLLPLVIKKENNQFAVNLGEMREQGLDFESYFAELTGKEIYYRNLVRDTTKINKEVK